MLLTRLSTNLFSNRIPTILLNWKRSCWYCCKISSTIL